MDTNIIAEYIDFVIRKILKFYRITLGNQYDRNLLAPFLEKYILVRYFNETNFPKEKDVVERIAKEMGQLLEEVTTEDNEELIKNVYALFGYVLYFDDCYSVENEHEILKALFEDENIKIEFSDKQKEELRDLIRKMRNSKTRFDKAISSTQFFLEEKRIKRNYYRLTLRHNVRVSSLYSESAIEKAFNTGTVCEDKIFVLLIMASHQILQNAANLDFSRYYVVNLPASLFSKEKKVERVMKTVDNVLTQKHLYLNIMYSEYLENKKTIDNLIRKGYPFAVTIDNSFYEDYESLIIFVCVLLYKDDERYDMIKENKKLIPTKLVIV